MGADRLSTPNFGAATKRFRDAGIAARYLLPVVPVSAKIFERSSLNDASRGKSPAAYNRNQDTWHGLGGSVVKTGFLDADELRRVQSWPTNNVGLCGAYAPGIDSDANSPSARRLVAETLEDVLGPNYRSGIRLRGDNDRLLYSFRCDDPENPDKVVRTRFIKYTLPDDPAGIKPHGFDIIGIGNHYVIAGDHVSGDVYDWHADWSLPAMWEADEIDYITNVDADSLAETLIKKITAAGGTIISSGSSRGAGFEETDWSDHEPIMSPEAILNGLDRLPNTPENFPLRDDLVHALAAARAALGGEAEGYRDALQDWACADDVWCPPEYFDKIWDSLQRGVRVGRTALDRLFKENKLYVSARDDFPNDAKEQNRKIQEHKAKRKGEVAVLLDKVAARFIFGDVNTRADEGAVRMRWIWDVSREWKAIDWWRFKSTDKDSIPLLLELQQHFKEGEAGFWDFMRQLYALHPDIFYSGETRDPRYNRGEIVAEENPSGPATRMVNMRYISKVIKYGEHDPENPKQAREDIKHLLDFIRRIFGELTEYELDTLAYMVQKKMRPGHLLFLVGEQGVGKSIYVHMLISMFDGIGKDMGGPIDGTKLTNESARRFILAKAEGVVILSVKELPDGAHNSPATMAAITASLKQIVDAGPDADYFQIERKHSDVSSVRNHCRAVITTNYDNAIKIEEQDRRTLYVRCGIDRHNKPDEDYYARLTDITGDPERLACLYRYLLTRNIEHYRPAAPPPVTLDKRAAQITGITDPLERHMAAAMELLRHSDRVLFDSAEIEELMSCMALNEDKQTSGAISDIPSGGKYKFQGGGGLAQAKRLDKYAVKIASFKKNGERLPTVYGLRAAKDRIAELASANRDDVLDALDEDRERHGLSQYHPIPVYSGPFRLRD